MENRPEKRPLPSSANTSDVEILGVQDGQGGAIIGEVEIYRSPSEKDPIAWAHIIDRYLAQNTVSCIGIISSSGDLIKITKESLDSLKDEKDQLCTSEIIGLAYQASTAKLVMLTKDRMTNSS